MIRRLSTRIALIAAAAFACVRAMEIGKPHSAVITLTAKNFDDYLADPANGLWLLKFYAPWYVRLFAHDGTIHQTISKTQRFISFF